jgi:hypothetical protein
MMLTSAFVSCFDACLDAVGVRPPLFFDPEDGGYMFLIKTTRRYMPEDETIHNHRC